MKRRVERVAELIKREMGKILLEDFKNAEIGFVTVTDVDLTPDLRLARIYISVYGSPEKQKQTLQIIQEHTPFFRKLIGQRVKLRFTPEVRFEYDNSIARAVKVFEILEKIKEKEQNR